MTHGMEQLMKESHVHRNLRIHIEQCMHWISFDSFCLFFTLTIRYSKFSSIDVMFANFSYLSCVNCCFFRQSSIFLEIVDIVWILVSQYQDSQFKMEYLIHYFAHWISCFFFRFLFQYTKRSIWLSLSSSQLHFKSIRFFFSLQFRNSLSFQYSVRLMFSPNNSFEYVNKDI